MALSPAIVVARPVPTAPHAALPTSWTQGYRPPDAWFAHQVTGIHGAGHAARVFIWADRLAQALHTQEGIAVDVEVVRRAAVLHDIRRLDDGRDPEHGLRCSDWLGRHPERLPGCTPRQREQVRHGCEWHVPHDAATPMMTPELICLKDADALDRARLDGLDRRRLRTAAARRWVRAAELLCHLSEVHVLRGMPHWDAVMHAARALGLLPALDASRAPDANAPANATRMGCAIEPRVLRVLHDH